MFEADIVIDRDLLPKFCLAQVLAKHTSEEPDYSTGSIEIHSIPLNRTTRHLVKVEGEGCALIAEGLVKLSKNKASLDFVSGSYMGVVDTPPCQLYSLLSETSCFLISESATERAMIWKVVAKSTSSIRTLVRNMNKTGKGAQIQGIRKITREDNLTARQAKMIETAYENGFFEYPRRVGMKELADSAGCSPSTFAVTLRKAEKKITAQNMPEITN